MEKRIVIESPTVARIQGVSAAEAASLGAQLTYRDEKVGYEIKKHKKAHWFINKFGTAKWKEKLDELQKLHTKCLLFEDERGWWTYSGLAGQAARVLGCPVENLVSYPDPGALGFDVRPYEPWAYQAAAQEKLLAARHAGVEIGTGLGKTLILTYIVKELGLKSVVMAPSLQIAEQIYKGMVKAFGQKKVGFFGDGKKVASKQITVAIAASLTRVEPGSEVGKQLAASKVFIADESHQCPAATLAKVCFGLMKDAPYRFFFSATQIRNDGLDLLLDAITGPIVYKMTVKEGIEKGYLAALQFFMVKTVSPSYKTHEDPNEETREHLYYNEKVLRQAAHMANMFISEQKKQVLILVEELEQFAYLYPFLKYPVKFAHGGAVGQTASKLPRMFHESDPSLFVNEFNEGKFPILVGTSCISMGTDLLANEATIYLQGGKSEIQVLQGPVGRSTRLHTFSDGRKKKTCYIVDFDVETSRTTHRHAALRQAIYERIAPVREIKYE